MHESAAELHREILIEHGRAPQGRGCLPDWDTHAHHRDADTGDEVTVWIKLVDGIITQIGWEARGSTLLQASCSLMCGLLTGKTKREALEAITAFVEMLTGADTNSDGKGLGDAIALIGIRHLPARVRCATLPWRTAENALR